MKDDFACPADKNIKAENRQLVLELMVKFNQEVPNEDAGLARLYQHFEECGLLKCQRCPDSGIRKITNRLIQCQSCDEKIWITAGTFFHGVRLVRPYLAAIYFKENGAVFGAPWFAKLLGIADSSAACILKKIGLVINNEVTNDASEVHSNSFVELICKRSRQTPAGEHPRAELIGLDIPFDSGSKVDLIDAGAIIADENDLLQNDGTPMPEPERVVFDLLSAVPVHFDILCQSSGMDAGELSATLLILELKGLALSESANRFIRGGAHKQKAKIMVQNSLFDRLHETLKQIHGGLSRKCLQIYSALFWCHMDRVRWGAGALLKACFKHPPIRYADVVAYISPLLIKVLQ